MFLCRQVANKRLISGYNIFADVSMAEKVEVSHVLSIPVLLILEC